MTKNIALMATVLVSAGIFSGCATIVSGKTQEVKFISDKPVEVTVDNQTITTPATVKLRREDSSKIAKVQCDGKTEQVVLQKKVNPWFAGNLLIGGVFGSTTDYASDAMWEYEDTVKIDCR